MVIELLILGLVTFIGSTLQTATGFGFALLAVTPFLMVLDSGVAFQLVMVICLVISLVIWPKLAGRAPKSLLAYLAAGCAAGFPIGLAAHALLDLDDRRRPAGAGAGLDPSPSIRRRISAKRSRRMATSASWNVM